MTTDGKLWRGVVRWRSKLTRRQFADDAMKTHGLYENSVKHAVELLHDLGVIIHYPDEPAPVSYTHLTLPTSDLV